MSALLLALALMTDPAPVAVVDPATIPPAAETQPPPAEVPPATDPAPPAAAEPEPAPVAVVETPYPPDAPKDDYGLVAWCYGLLSGYLELHDRVLPEVTRIEGAFRKPGTSLADDMAVYEDMQKVSRANMKLFERAMEAAERASIRPINQVGAAAVARGRSTWSAAANLPTRIVAQQWMGWTLPGVCPTRAEALETRAKLMGLTFKVNEPSPEAAAAEAPPPSAAAEPIAPPPQEVAPEAPAPVVTDEAAPRPQS